MAQRKEVAISNGALSIQNNGFVEEYGEVQAKGEPVTAHTHVLVTDINGNTAWGVYAGKGEGRTLGPLKTSGALNHAQIYLIVSTNDGRFLGYGPGEYFSANKGDQIQCDADNTVQRVITPGNTAFKITGAWTILDEENFDPNNLHSYVFYTPGEIQASFDDLDPWVFWVEESITDGENDTVVVPGPDEVANKGFKIIAQDVNGVNRVGYVGLKKVSENKYVVMSEPYIWTEPDLEDPDPPVYDPPLGWLPEGVI